MGCNKCKSPMYNRPIDSILLRYPKPCSDCLGKHDWVKLAAHGDKDFCRFCRVGKRVIGVNGPCPGKPMWLTSSPAKWLRHYGLEIPGKAIHVRIAPRQPSRSYSAMVITHYTLPGSLNEKGLNLRLGSNSSTPNRPYGLYTFRRVNRHCLCFNCYILTASLSTLASSPSKLLASSGYAKIMDGALQPCFGKSSWVNHLPQAQRSAIFLLYRHPECRVTLPLVRPILQFVHQWSL